MKLDKLTLDYVAAEDRVLLRAQDTDGRVVAFWLTLRMSRALQKFLVKHLENQTPKLASTDHEVLQTFRQTSALMKLGATEAVQDAASEPVLLTTLDLQRQPNGVVLQLPLASGGTADLTLDSVQLRQYLHILRRMFLRAEWPLDGWPAWMGEAAAEATGAGDSARALH